MSVVQDLVSNTKHKQLLKLALTVSLTEGKEMKGLVQTSLIVGYRGPWFDNFERRGSSTKHLDISPKVSIFSW